MGGGAADPQLDRSLFHSGSFFGKSNSFTEYSCSLIRLDNNLFVQYISDSGRQFAARLTSKPHEYIVSEIFVMHTFF